MERFRLRRGLAAPVLAIAFAAVAATFRLESTHVASLDPVAAGVASVAITLAGYPVVAVVASRTTLGEAIAEWSYGPVLVRPPRAAVGLVTLSLCLSVAWLVVRSELPMAIGSLVAIVTLPLYLPLYLLYLGTFAASVLATGSGALFTPAVHVGVFTVGAALSAVWQLLLASALVHRAAGAGRSAAESDCDPHRVRK